MIEKWMTKTMWSHIQLDGIEDVARIGKEIRQKDALCPILFTVYIEEDIKEIKKWNTNRNQSRWINVMVIRFANKIVFCTKKEDLQILFDKMEDILGN